MNEINAEINNLESDINGSPGEAQGPETLGGGSSLDGPTEQKSSSQEIMASEITLISTLVMAVSMRI